MTSLQGKIYNEPPIFIQCFKMTSLQGNIYKKKNEKTPLIMNLFNYFMSYLQGNSYKSNENQPKKSYLKTRKNDEKTRTQDKKHQLFYIYSTFIVNYTLINSNYITTDSKLNPLQIIQKLPIKKEERTHMTLYLSLIHI